MEDSDYESLLEKTIGAVKRAGAEAMKFYGGEYPVKKKEDDSPVTRADLNSERIIIDGLKDFGYGILAEESGLQGARTDRFWVVDPLDGTRDFIQETDEFSIMVGLLEGEKPVLGVVYAPALGKLWHAVRGEGAFLRQAAGAKREISTSAASDLEEFRIVVSRNHFRERDKRIAQSLGIRSVKRMGSVGVKFSTIAEGEAELCLYTTGFLGPWDCCAPQAILEEAGGTVFDRRGEEPFYDPAGGKMERGFIGTNGGFRKEVVAAVRAEFKD